MKRKVKLILDSGAYTAWRMNRQVDLKAYIAFIHKFHDYLESYVNLDVIPGTPGGHKSQAQVEESAEQGWKNLMTMKKAGLEPIPVYHMGERRYWLEKMIGEGFKTVALGGVAPLADEVRQPWLDEVFDFLCRPRGYPSVNIHGLGITSVPLILRYPWTSTDSVSWLQAAANGGIYVPQQAKGGGYDYGQAPYVVLCSVQKNGEVGKAAMGHARHLDNYGHSIKRYVLDYLKAEDIDHDAVRRDYIQRDRVNIRFFQRMAEAHPLKPYHTRTRGFFDADSEHGHTKHPSGKFDVYFVIAERQKYGQVLVAEKAWRQLVTFFWFQYREIFDVKRYITTGEMVYTPVVRKGRVRIK